VTLALATAAALAATLALAGAASAQAPLVTDAGAVAPTASAPEPLWVPDPQTPAAAAASDAAPAADVSAAAAAAPVAPAVTDAGQVAIAHWMALGARDAGLPDELPVMAALTESGLRNLAYGDRDSVGYFQMRRGIWDSGAYAGYLARPELQLRWFLDHALAVRSARVAAGDAAFGADPAGWGAWVAEVERPAEPYRGRYQGQLETARALLAAPAPALAPFELALTVDGAPVPAAGPAADPLAARVMTDARIELSATARGDLLAGRIDPRLEAVLLTAAERAPISVSVLQTGHPYLTVNGTVSNHSFGRAADIAAVDGAPVSPDNAAAHDLAVALGKLAPEIRPTEIGSPWAIDSAAYFSDGDHQDHLHVGFDDPAAVAATATQDATVAAVAAAAAPGPPPRPGLEPAEPSFKAAGGGGAGASSEPRFRSVGVRP
jgi:hypothetical protein